MDAGIHSLCRRPQNPEESTVMISGFSCRKSLFPLAGYLFILLLLLPLPVLAQDPVDLTIEKTGVFPWSVAGILPGDRGSTFIDLHNNGTENGIVFVWVDNISTSDRYGNPGGGLANYMYFNISHPHLNSTVILPARINSFPNAPLMPGQYIIIDSFSAGDTIRINWTWEFVETGQPQNDAQNNTLHFTISYTLVNLTAPVAPTPVPSGIEPGVPTGPANFPPGPSIFEALGMPGLNPFERPQLGAPAQEPPDTESLHSEIPDHKFIMIIALFMIASAFIVHSQRNKYPEWKVRGEILLAVGIAVTFIGILFQSYLISIQNGQHLASTHSVIGLIATFLIIPVLVFWNRQNNLKVRDNKIIWIYVLWVVTAFVCLVFGLQSVGIL